jgi:4-diphosphocytidyl-2-C-methyl-D-erythritol kinase
MSQRPNDSLPGAVRVAVPAKINLHLRVGPPTPDGFHPLTSWMVTVGLFDNLEFTFTDAPGVRLTCDDPAIPTDTTNLVVKCARAILDESGLSSRGVSITLRKRIPVGAGLGGGSADGAFTLIALNRLLGLHWPAGRLAEIASRFGSDLAFFCHGPSSVCTGRGEVVEPTPAPRSGYVVLILPGIHMATPAVYRRFDEMRLGDGEALRAATDWRHWATLGAAEILPRLVNDLEAPAFSLSEALRLLHARASEALGGRIVRMSGSGSSLFTLFDTAGEAETSAARLRLTLGVRVEAAPLAPDLREIDTGGARINSKGE